MPGGSRPAFAFLSRDKRMTAPERQGPSTPQLNPLACALVNALRSKQTAKAWTHLRDLVCERVRAMRLAGESKASVLNTLTSFARTSLHGELRSPELERIAEELLAEVSLWCIDEYDSESPTPTAVGASGRGSRSSVLRRHA
jgi:hypothetical protein